MSLNDLVTMIFSSSYHLGSIRLVDGLTPNEGRLEIYHADRWGTLCCVGWNMINAGVACRELGYEAAVLVRYVIKEWMSKKNGHTIMVLENPKPLQRQEVMDI